MRFKDFIISTNTGLDAIKRAPIVDCDTGLKCIRIQDISQNKGFEDWGYTEVTESDYKKFKLQYNDILVARTGATVGVSYIVKQDYNAVYNNGSIRLRFSTDVNTDFIYYILQTKEFLKFIDNVSCVATQPNLRIETLLRFVIPDYSLQQQTKIAAILSKYDELIELNNKRIKKLEQTAEELYKEWFVRFRFPNYQNTEFENGIPNNWIVGRINDIVNIYDKKRIPLSSMVRDGMEKLYPYYGAAEMLDYVDDYIFDGKYLLLGEDGSVVTPEGYPVLQMVYGKFWVNNHAHILQGKDGFSTELLYLTFKKMNVNGIVTGSAQPKISQARFLNKHILIPDHKLLSLFNGIIQPIFDKRKSLFDANDNLIKQRDLLLPRLMSGKLEV